MRFNFAVFSGFLLASAVLADPYRRDHRTQLLNTVRRSAGTASVDYRYNSHWAGAYWTENSDADSVHADITVPTASSSIGSSASVFVGIDGVSCETGALQVGFDITVTENGTSYIGWHEWFPDDAQYFPDLHISAGDDISVSVVAHSPTSGIVVIENLTNGEREVAYLNSTHELCRRDMVWVVGDYTDGNSHLVPFANFGAVTFSEATAAYSNGFYTAEGANIIDIKQNGTVLTSTSASGCSLTVKHV